MSVEEFDRANEILLAPKKRPNTKREYLLRGNIVKCGCCGHAMSYDGKNEPVYRCCHTRGNVEAACNKWKVYARDLDEIVLTAIRKKAEIVLNCADLSKLRRKTTNEQKIGDCEKLIEQNAEERRQLYESFALGETSRDEYLKQKAENTANLDRLNRQLSAMKAEQEAARINPNAVAAARNAVNDLTSQRELVEILIETVHVHPDMRVDIKWKIADFATN